MESLLSSRQAEGVGRLWTRRAARQGRFLWKGRGVLWAGGKGALSAPFPPVRPAFWGAVHGGPRAFHGKSSSLSMPEHGLRVLT